LKAVDREVETVAELLGRGEVICCPTDTQLGLIGSALNAEAVKRVYDVKGRRKGKPLIVLFSSIEQVETYGVEIPEVYRDTLRSIWPERLTAILPLKGESPFKTIFGRENLAVRVPKDGFLLKLTERAGPLFAPSANPEGKPPARNCEECAEYFNGLIDFCVKDGQESELPSTIVDFTVYPPKVVREGAFKFKLLL